MRTLVFGGTGFLGYHLARALGPERREIVLFGRGRFAPHLELPKSARLLRGDIASSSDEALKELLSGFDEVVFAAGKDDRAHVREPPREIFMRENVKMLERVFTAMEGSPVKRFVVCGSFFSTADRRHPEWELTKIHPYIDSRAKQQSLVERYRGIYPHVGFTVLEIPFVMGALPGSQGVFSPMIRWMEQSPVMFALPGRISVVAVEDISSATRRALEAEQGLGLLPVGTWDMTYKEWMKLVLEEMGLKRPVVVLPKQAIKPFLRSYHAWMTLRGVYAGLDYRKLPDLLSEDLGVLDPNSMPTEDEKARVRSAIRALVHNEKKRNR